jgi:hypothetical protein
VGKQFAAIIGRAGARSRRKRGKLATYLRYGQPARLQHVRELFFKNMPGMRN